MPDFDEDSPRLPMSELKLIARYQRWVIACVLAQITMWLCLLVMSFLERGWIETDIPLFLTVLLDIAGAVYAFLIYWTMRNPFLAVVMGLASIPPLLGLLALTAVNSTATRTLTANGVHVGFFGVDLNKMEEEGGIYYDDEDAGW